MVAVERARPAGQRDRRGGRGPVEARERLVSCGGEGEGWRGRRGEGEGSARAGRPAAARGRRGVPGGGGGRAGPAEGDPGRWRGRPPSLR